MRDGHKVITFVGTFDEAAFRSYTELYLRPHTRGAGWWFMAFFGIFGAFYGFYAIDTALSPSRPKDWFFAVSTFIFAVSAAYFLLGLCMVTGIRRPRWGKRRWDARTRIAFERLRRHDLKNPLCMGLDYDDRPHDAWPFPFRTFLIFFFLGYVFIDDDPLTWPLAYDTVPGLLPRFKDVPEGVELSVEFAGAFLPDRIEKGFHGVVFAEAYSDIHDVVEDRKRHPDLAIIRHKDGYSELVVLTDRLEGGTWDEVKLRILEAVPDAFPLRERRRLAKLKERARQEAAS